MQNSTKDTLRLGAAALVIGSIPVLLAGDLLVMAQEEPSGRLAVAALVTTTVPPTTTTTVPPSTAPPTTLPPETTTTQVPETTVPPSTAPPPTQAPAPSVYYGSCDEARAAGVAPLYEGEPGYSTSLDRDRDGVACE